MMLDSLFYMLKTVLFPDVFFLRSDHVFIGQDGCMLELEAGLPTPTKRMWGTLPKTMRMGNSIPSPYHTSAQRV